MKSFLLLITFLCLSFLSYSQTNSVELKDGGGTLISSHSSVQAAYNAIPASIASAYIIEILSAYDGTSETLPIIFSSRTGSSSVNTITIRPAAGNTGESISGTVSGTGGVPIINFDGCEYVILDGRPGGVGDTLDLSVSNFSTALSSYTIQFINGASNNTVKYLYTYNGSGPTAGGRNFSFATSTGPNGNSNNLVTDCLIEGGRSGVSFSGTANYLNENNVIQYCELKSFGFTGVWFLSNSSNTTVNSCKIYQTAGVNTSGVSGINLAISGARGITNIIKCKIYDIQMTSTSTSATVRGIMGGVAAGATINVVNNFISLPLNNNNASVYGINFTGTADFNVNLIYNSIFIGGTHSGGTAGTVVSGGIVKSNTSDTSVYVQKNNICLNLRTGGTSGAFHVGGFIASNAVVGTFDIDYNDYFASGDPGSFNAGWAGVLHNNIADYRTAASPNEMHSKFHPVNFVSPTDLHLTGPSVGDTVLAGISIAGITDDIDGEVRYTTPYMGADEGEIIIPVELSSFTANAQNSSVQISWTTATETNNKGFSIQRKTNSTQYTDIAFVEGKGTTTEENRYSFTDKGLLNGTYYYRLKQIDLDGTASFSKEVKVQINIPVVFSLEQNYPNPFNPATVIKYSIPAEGNVNLTVYNTLGQKVAVLINENLKAGNYEYKFNASQLSSGLYLYRLESGKNVSTKKMLLLK